MLDCHFTSLYVIEEILTFDPWDHYKHKIYRRISLRHSSSASLYELHIIVHKAIVKIGAAFGGGFSHCNFMRINIDKFELYVYNLNTYLIFCCELDENSYLNSRYEAIASSLA